MNYHNFKNKKLLPPYILFNSFQKYNPFENIHSSFGEITACFNVFIYKLKFIFMQLLVNYVPNISLKPINILVNILLVNHSRSSNYLKNLIIKYWHRRFLFSFHHTNNYNLATPFQ